MRSALFAALLASCTCENRARLDAARARVTPHLDGKLDEAVWRKAPSSGPFTGKGIVAHTELRAAWDLDGLYLALYAADEDVGKEDQIRVRVEEVETVVTPTSAGVDTDGTIDDSSDDDEEWTAELKFPWKSLHLPEPPAEVKVAVERSDRPKGAELHTMSWAGTLRLRGR